MHNTKKSSSRISLIKGIVLLSILVIALLFVSSLRRFGLPAQVSSLLNVDYDVSRQKIVQIPESKQDSIRKTFAGFWVSATENNDAAVKKYNNIEIKDNGIIWQVIKWFVTFPSGDTLSMYHVRNAYLMPYGQHQGKSGYACDVRIIRQIFIVGNDTCYGSSNTDNLWLLENTSGGLKLNNLAFGSYDGELSNFFPEGMINHVDDLLLKSCSPGANMQVYATDAIKKQLENLAPMSYKSEAMQQWITHYYEPLVIDDALHSQMFYSIPESLTVTFKISPDGKVIEPKLKSGVKGIVSDLLIRNVSSWFFPRHTSVEQVPETIYTFHLNNN